MATPYLMQPRDAQLALTEFSEAFDAALAIGDPDPWSARLGYLHTSSSVRTRFPLPISQAGFRERLGDDVLRDLYAVSLDVVPKEWVDGVKVKARLIEDGDFVGWAKEPANMAREAMRHKNELVAAMLEANPYLDLYRVERPGGSTASAVELFSASHPVNIRDSGLSTFDNDIAGSINEALITALKLYFRTLKGPNGKPLGLQLGSLLVCPTHEEAVADLLTQDTLVQAVTNVGGTENVGGIPKRNRHKDVSFDVSAELSSTSFLYAFAKDGPPAWVLQTVGMPEEIVFDKTDTLYKETGEVGLKYVLEEGVAAALPHGVVRVTIS